MIWDSHPWKVELGRLGRSLQRRRTQKRWGEASLAKFEREIFLMAFIIRRLLESNKLSDELESTSISALSYPQHGRVVDFLNWHRLDDLYDLKEGKPLRLSLSKLCNEIMHSFVFLPSFDDATGSLAGVYVASDRDKDKRVLKIELTQLVETARRVVSDEIVYAEWARAAIAAPATVVIKSRNRRSKAPDPEHLSETQRIATNEHLGSVGEEDQTREPHDANDA